MKQTEELIRLTQRLRFHKVKVSPAQTLPLTFPHFAASLVPSLFFLPGSPPGLLVAAPGIAGGADRAGVSEGWCALHLPPALHSPLPAALQ